VDLCANPVVLVVGDCSRAEHRHDLVGILFRLREHEGEGMEEIHACRVESVAPGEQRCGADVARQHVRAPDRGERTSEGLGDGRLDEAFLQTDAKLTEENLDDEADALSVEFAQQLDERFSLSRGQRQRRETVECLTDFR